MRAAGEYISELGSFFEESGDAVAEGQEKTERVESRRSSPESVLMVERERERCEELQDGSG